jgi:hypothetical protein
MHRKPAVQLVAMLAGIGAIAGFVTAQYLPRQFVGRSAVGCSGAVCGVAAAQTLSYETLKPIVLQSPFYREELDYTPADEVVQRIRDNASIHSAKSGSREAWRVEFIDADRYAAMEMAQLLTEKMAQNIGPAAPVVEQVHTSVTGPSAALCTLAGIAAGLTIGLEILVLLRMFPARGTI